MIFDCLSAFQVGNYIDQINSTNAPTGSYSYRNLQVFYWRDIISCGCSYLILLLCCHLSNIIGWLSPIISYQRLKGIGIDRTMDMRVKFPNKTN